MHKRPTPFLRFVTDGGEGGGTEPGDGEKPAEFKAITTQDEFNRVIAGRIDAVKAKFADYKDIKAKADRLDSLEAANKSEAEKTAERFAALESENARIKSDAMRSRIQAKHGITDEDADLFLTGTDEETLTRQASALAGKVADRKKQGNVAPKEGTNGEQPKGNADLREFTKSLFGSSD